MSLRQRRGHFMRDGDGTMKAATCIEEYDESSSSNDAVRVYNGHMAGIGLVVQSA